MGICKVLTYEFHYEYIKNIHGKNSRLLLADTDSLMYQIKGEDIYKDFSKNKEMFDFSNNSTNSKYYDDSNKWGVGKMKNEKTGVTIEVLVGLKPKIYSFLVDDSGGHKKMQRMWIKMLLQQ